MAQKTTITAEDGKQEVVITRAFDLPVDLLFKAHVEPDIVAQWMGTNVLKLEAKQHGGWQYETTDAEGNVVFKANGVFHEVILSRRITRTFEMESVPPSAVQYPAQLEFLEFEALTPGTSKLRMHIVFRSVADRNQLLQLPFAQGLNMAHNRLQSIVNQLKPNVP